jgi:transposase
MQCPQKVRHFFGGIFMSRKIKYSLAFKLAIVKEVQRGEDSTSGISNKHLLNKSMVQRWVMFYERFGESGLLPQSNRYSLETKLAVIKALDDNNLSLIEACLQFNIRSMGVLMNWIRIYDLEGIEGLSNEKRGKNRLMSSKKPKKTQSNPLTEHEKILEENKRLRAEVAFLKKLHALIQKEEAEKKRKR